MPIISSFIVKLILNVACITCVACVSIMNTFLQAYMKLRTKFESEMAVILQKQLRVGFNVLCCFFEFS